MENTEQMVAWEGKMGKEYTDRNFAPELMAGYDKSTYGVTREALNYKFVGSLSGEIRILEVGANVGNQLLLLQKMGFRHLYGLELQRYASDMAKNKPGIDIIAGSALDIPFKDGNFDLVVTNGLLIHIAPADIVTVMKEIYRCTSRYIWGLEYWAEKYTEINWRGKDNMLWKTNYKQLYLDTFPNLKILNEEYLHYTDNDNIDEMYLLEKS